MSAVRAALLFTSTSVVSDCIAIHQDQMTMAGKRIMMASAKRRILLVDHTKFGKVSLHKLAPLRELDLVVVDLGIDDVRLEDPRESSVPFEVVPLYRHARSPRGACGASWLPTQNAFGACLSEEGRAGRRVDQHGSA